ncbi:uncharacterized protein VP01_2059g3, partial [Puccinia sorghi]
WKASKEKEKTNYFMSLLTLWIKSSDQKSRIILDSDATFPIKGKGTVRLTWGKSLITLDNCLFVPDIVINLIRAGKLDSKGCILHSERSRFTVSKNGKPALKGSINNGLYSVNNPSLIGPDKLPLINMTSPKESLQEILEKYGHTSIQRIGTLLDDSFSRTERDSFECKYCVLAKITKQPFNVESPIVNKPFEHIHLDLIGPIKPESSLKHQFILTVVNNHSGYLAGFPLVHKDDTTDILINLLKTEQMQRGYFPSLICSDGGEANFRTLSSGTQWQSLRDASDDDHAKFKKLNINYRSAIGLLNHIAQLTRPDISFAVSSLARFSNLPNFSRFTVTHPGAMILKIEPLNLAISAFSLVP